MGLVKIYPRDPNHSSAEIEKELLYPTSNPFLPKSAVVFVMCNGDRM